MHVAAVGQCCLDRLAIVDRYPSLDEKTEAREWQIQIGGPAATAMVTLARLGVSTRLAGITGDDIDGRLLLDKLNAAGVGTSNVLTRNGATSQTAFIAVERGSGKRTIFWKRTTGEELQPAEIGEELFHDCSFLLLDGLMADASLHAAKMARVKDIPVMLDAGRLRPNTSELLPYCDYVVASEFCAHQLGWGSPSFTTRARQLAQRAATFTFGERGSVTYANGASFETSAFAVDAVDTTGAGDVFHGAYIYALLQQWPMAEVLRFASAVAAIKCTRLGGTAGIPDLSEVGQFLAARQA